MTNEEALRDVISGIIKQNIDVFYNRDQDRLEINVDEISQEIVDHIRLNPREFVNPVDMDTLKKGAAQFYDSGYLDEVTAGMDKEKTKWETYYQGFFDGYVNSFTDTTGEDFFT